MLLESILEPLSFRASEVRIGERATAIHFLEATLIGAVGGITVVYSITMLDRVFKIDDPVGAISVHGVVGLWGLLAVPLTNSDVSFTGQLAGAGTIFVWVFGTSLVLWLILKAIMGSRI